MMSQTYIAPDIKLEAFTCLHCGVLTQQRPFNGYRGELNYLFGSHREETLLFRICDHCQERTIWYKHMIIYPNSGAAPMPNPDMPDDVVAEYMEARDIVSKSPKGAVALLRLGLQKLCVHLGQPGKNINLDIASLVAQGLPKIVQQSLDIVRVIGNEAVHPGQINLNDTPETATTLFRLLNFIVEDRITRPNEVEQLYAALPEDKRKGIEDRDKNSNP
jgi:hypothetical protein